MFRALIASTSAVFVLRCLHPRAGRVPARRRLRGGQLSPGRGDDGRPEAHLRLRHDPQRQWRRGPPVRAPGRASEPSTEPPVIETGSDLGTQPIYGGLVPIAQRTGRRLIIVDLQGTGHSTPLLDCPEVNALATTVAADPGGSTATVVDAITACRERLTSHGIDPTTVDYAGTAENLHAVTKALDIPRAVAMGHGTTGAVAIEWARRYPDEVEALVLDSPQLRDPSPGAVVDQLVDEVSRLCAIDDGCRERYGDPGRSVARRPPRPPTQAAQPFRRQRARPSRRPGAAPSGDLADRRQQPRAGLDSGARRRGRRAEAGRHADEICRRCCQGAASLPRLPAELRRSPRAWPWEPLCP